MTFKEFYNKLDLDISFNNDSFMDKEFILDDCKEDTFEDWNSKTDSEKINLFLKTFEYYISNNVIKDIKNNINA
tara:strand:- start:302 stop:523 length:222 start_codon:yes stop_codon:yes gene_type:complete